MDGFAVSTKTMSFLALTSFSFLFSLLHEIFATRLFRDLMVCISISRLLKLRNFGNILDWESL